MPEEIRRPRPAAQYGPTAHTVAANVKRVRDARDLTIYQLSALLKAKGRPIAPSAVAKIERGERQVTVDDLVALAVVLGVNPSALLLPLTDEPNRRAEVTGAGDVAADDAWDWVDGKRPLVISTEDDELLFDLLARPRRRRNYQPTVRPTTTEELMDDPRARRAFELMIEKIVKGEGDGESLD